MRSGPAICVHRTYVVGTSAVRGIETGSVKHCKRRRFVRPFCLGLHLGRICV